MVANRHGITQLRVGRLIRAHGLKGALKVELYTDEPERRFVPGATFSLQVPVDSPWRGRPLVLREFRSINESPYAFFEGVEDRSTAESLVRAILWVDQDDTEELAPNTWYDHQLVGLRAVLDADGSELGTVTRVDHLPAQDLFVIATDHGEVMVPFVSEIVPVVDVDAGLIRLTPPGGLFDLADGK